YRCDPPPLPENLDSEE
ncbi:hypothetical protein A2U01_0061754, partial [Trifolium medium]|nr:hypothetical protein [Trifolium medium]